MSRSVNVVAILGSPRAPSYTRSLAVAVVRALETRGAAVETLDLRATPLPPMMPELRAKRCEHPDPEAARLLLNTASSRDSRFVSRWRGACVGILNSGTKATHFSPAGSATSKSMLTCIVHVTSVTTATTRITY